MNTNNTAQRFLVIGASGKTGQLVYASLKENGHIVRAASRNTQIPFDWYDESTWADSIDGMTSIYLTFYPDLAVPAAPGIITKFLELAKEHNVQHIVMLSGRGEAAAQHCEQLLQNSGIAWNVVRASWFNQNFHEGAFLPFIEMGKLSLPVKEVTEPFIDTRDIAAVAVECLVNPALRNRLFEVTGPELLTFADLADKFSAQLSKPVVFEAITLDRFTVNMKTAGLPEDVIEMLQYLFTEVLDGRNEYLSAGLEEALNRSPITFDQYISDHLNVWEK